MDHFYCQLNFWTVNVLLVFPHNLIHQLYTLEQHTLDCLAFCGLVCVGSSWFGCQFPS